jgi:hypothetical protein
MTGRFTPTASRLALPMPMSTRSTGAKEEAKQIVDLLKKEQDCRRSL